MGIPWWIHQRRWKADRSRFRIALKARQIGWTTIAAGEALDDALLGKTTIMGSRSKRQANEMMGKVRALAVIALAGTPISLAKDNADELVLSTGGRVLSIPAHPDTIAGFTGNVILDEYARHQKSREIWEALFPTISSRPDLRLSVLSTPMGRAGKFYDLVREAQRPGSEWSLHRCDIYDAVASGCGHNIEQLRAACQDEQTFRQSYLCEFVDEAYALLPYDLLQACTDEHLTYTLGNVAPKGELFVGVDVGRRHNLTVICVLSRVGRTYTTAGFIELAGTPFAGQRAELARVLGLPGARRCCMDATGLGMQLAEEAVARWGKWRVEGVTMTPAIKASLAGLVRATFDDRRIYIPDHDPLLADLHSVERQTTIDGAVRFRATELEGSHADRFTALALALYAGEQVKFVDSESIDIVLTPPRVGMW